MNEEGARKKRAVKIRKVARLKKRLIKFQKYLTEVITSIEEIEKGK
jgi:hypothetical protein